MFGVSGFVWGRQSKNPTRKVRAIKAHGDDKGDSSDGFKKMGRQIARLLTMEACTRSNATMKATIFRQALARRTSRIKDLHIAERCGCSPAVNTNH